MRWIATPARNQKKRKTSFLFAGLELTTVMLVFMVSDPVVLAFLARAGTELLLRGMVKQNLEI
jgi:hypothetical protein